MIGRMRVLLKFLLVAVLLAGVVCGIAWFWAGRSAGPTIEIRQPGAFVGQASTLETMVETPDGNVSRVIVTVEQNDNVFPVVDLDEETLVSPGAGGVVAKQGANQLYIMRPVGKRAIPELQPGAARIVVRAARPVLYGFRQIESTATKDVQVRLEQPRVAVMSMFHFVNHGGSEFVVYRATPEDVQSGVRVGNKEYPGFPASGIGIGGDPALRVAFFALLYDQDLNTKIDVFARDPAGNEAVTPLDYRVFPKPYKKSRIDIDDRFLNRVVPAIASNSPNEDIPTDDVLKGFLQINGELRRKNNQYLRDLAKKTSPQMLFKDVFQQLGNSQVEAE